MIKVSLLNKTSSLVNKVLPKEYQVVDASKNPVACPDPDGIIVRSFSMQEPYALPDSVFCVARAGAGVNNIPFDKYAEKGVIVFNTPGANANAVKELVLCSLFMCARRLVPGMQWVQSVKGQPDVAKLVEDNKSAYAGTEILGKNIGLIGLGAIGLLVAETAAALGMHVYGYSPSFTAEKAAKLKNFTLVKSVDEIYAECDYISLHLPFKKGSTGTEGMINTATLAKCRDGVNIINCARGELVVNADIITAIESGKVNRYVTDFPVDGLLGCDKIIAIPHLGASTAEAEDNCIIMAGKQMVDFIEDGNIVNSVNYPNVSLDRCCAKSRVTVAFKGNVDVKGEATKQGGKVCSYSEGKKGDFGYAIIDCEKPAELKNGLERLTGVIKVRQI